MTAQVPDILSRRGRAAPLFSNPLEPMLAARGARPRWMVALTTARRRGYVATWTIARRRLYLVDVGADGADTVLAAHAVRTARLRRLFPEADGRVFADWFSGDLRVPRGECVEYVHLGYASHYERDLIIRIDRGVVLGAHVICHTLDDARGLAAQQIATRKTCKPHPALRRLEDALQKAVDDLKLE